MGSYVTPGNEGFAEIPQRCRVDKTGLISAFDDTLGSQSELVLGMRADAVAEGLARFHGETTAPVLYNGE